MDGRTTTKGQAARAERQLGHRSLPDAKIGRSNDSDACGNASGNFFPGNVAACDNCHTYRAGDATVAKTAIVYQTAPSKTPSKAHLLRETMTKPDWPHQTRLLPAVLQR